MAHGAHSDPQKWSDLESRLGVTGLQAFTQKTIQPQLDRLGTDQGASDKAAKAFMTPIVLGFVGFAAGFTILDFILPESPVFILFRFLLFLPLFFGILVLMIYLFRGRLAQFMVAAKQIFLIRSQILKDIAGRLGITYVPLPGGPAPMLKSFAAWKHCPEIFKDMVALMDEHSGLEKESDIIRRSGLANPGSIVLGSKESKDKYHAQFLENLQFEDGFHGQFEGIEFSVLEWTQTEDETSEHHLMLVLDLPHPVTGRVEFRNKKGRWPIDSRSVGDRLEKAGFETARLQEVRLNSGRFKDIYKVRASDQVEGHFIFDPLVMERLTTFAHDGPVSGVAFDGHLVIDVIGDKRFEIVEMLTGAWSDETIWQTFEDLAETRELVSAIAHAFSLRQAKAG